MYPKQIKNKHNFQCPGNNCNAQITCANLDKNKSERIQKVNFRIYGTHTDNCSIKKDIDNNTAQKSKNKQNNNYNCNDFILTFSSPNNHKQSSILNINKVDNYDTHLQLQSNIQIKKYNATHKHSLNSLKEILDYLEQNQIITDTLSIKEKNILYNCHLPIQDANIPSDIIQKKIDKNHDNTYYFYRDKGWVNKQENNTFRINFKTKSYFKETNYNVCFFINSKQIEEINDTNYVIETLNTLSESKKYQDVCILYKTIQLVQKSDKNYLRLKLDQFYLCTLT